MEEEEEEDVTARVGALIKPLIISLLSWGVVSEELGRFNDASTAFFPARTAFFPARQINGCPEQSLVFHDNTNTFVHVAMHNID
eukprot:scaffold194148_cov27-Attheya_sp.AAC.1